MNSTIIELKTHFPAFQRIDDFRFESIIAKMGVNPIRSKDILLKKRFSEVPPNYDYRAVLESFQLPEGWGNFLRFFTDQVIDAISQDMPLTAISAIVGDPHLTLLLQIVQIYSCLLSSSKNNTTYSIVTRRDAKDILQEDTLLGAFSSNTQELLDSFILLTKLRRGKTRLHQRIIDCVDRMLTIEW